MGKVYVKIIVPALVAVLLFILTIFGFIIPRTQKNIMDGKREMIRELTNSAWSILSKYENDERQGLISRIDAQNTAASRIEYLRYGVGNQDYFWITDRHPNMIMHPYRRDLNGKDLSNFSDPRGKRLFVEFVETVKKSGTGYVDYMWQWKDDSLHIVPKLSYVKLFEPWGWIIGTGVYIEDVKTEIKSLTNRLIWMSGGISSIILMLLIFISQQSIRSEMKRTAAEKELHDSKERYRTLVEAATDGLVVLTEGKISFCNTVFCTLTGYDYSELQNLPLNEILKENNNRDTNTAFLKNSMTEGQYELNLSKKNGGFSEVLVKSSIVRINEKQVNILIIKDITIDRNSDITPPDYKKMLNALNLGFFRARFDHKGRFIHADELAVKILGYNEFSQLEERTVFSFLPDDEERMNLRKELLDNGYLVNKVVRILKNTREPAFVSITMILFNSLDSGDLIFDGIIEEVTGKESERADSSGLIARLKLSSFMMEQPVNGFLSPVVTLDAEATIGQAIKQLSAKKSDYLLVTGNERNFIGIITASDIQQRVLSLQLRPENPAYLIMTSPVVSVLEHIPVHEAIKTGREKGINHLVAKNHAQEITGVLRLRDVYHKLSDSLSCFVSDVEGAETVEQVKQSYKQLGLFIRPLISAEVSVKYITDITSSFSDAVIRKVTELAILELGTPPVAFSFICLGSEGRKEETLFTDQDNAIIYGHVSPEKEKSTAEYFRKLGDIICHSLNFTGYSFCKGNIMAKNPQWCQPVSGWETYFSRWILTPEPQNLLDATIFFDFRPVYGEEHFTLQLRDQINSQIAGRGVFLYHLAQQVCHGKYPHLPASTISDKGSDPIDLKHLVNFVVMFARLYALQNNISPQNTLERLDALKERNLINDTSFHELRFSYNYLMKLRFRNQVYQAENKLPLSNYMNIKLLTNFELSILKDIVSHFPVYQRMIAADFRVTD